MEGPVHSGRARTGILRVGRDGELVGWEKLSTFGKADDLCAVQGLASLGWSCD